jgi:photosystem II stability/assembly factor-like uncharacterized protein
MKIYLIILVLFIPLICASCAKESSADSISFIEPSIIPKIIEAKANVIDKQTSAVKITEMVFNKRENNSKVYFVDKDNGWLVGNIESDNNTIASNLYKTENGGKTWKKVSVEIEEEAIFRNIFFINWSVGWINIQKYGDVNSKKAKSWLMKTTDGGKNWQTLIIQDFTTVDEIKFIDEKNGWMTGSTHNPQNVYDTKQFFRKTTDGGNSWTEIGKNLFEKNGLEETRQMITGLIAETPENLKVVMWSGKLFETKDAGESWHRFGPQFDFPMQTLPDNFGKLGNSQRLRIARGTWSIEGIYSYIATEKDGDWTIRWTDESLCIYDILFLSENEMIAVGRLGVNLYEKNHRELGVILYSSDAGENWKIAYRNKSISEINSLSEITENQFIAVGNNGLIINIDLKK